MDNSERLALSYANWDSYCKMKQDEVNRIERARSYYKYERR